MQLTRLKWWLTGKLYEYSGFAAGRTKAGEFVTQPSKLTIHIWCADAMWGPTQTSSQMLNSREGLNSKQIHISAHLILKSAFSQRADVGSYFLLGNFTGRLGVVSEQRDTTCGPAITCSPLTLVMVLSQYSCSYRKCGSPFLFPRVYMCWELKTDAPSIHTPGSKRRVGRIAHPSLFPATPGVGEWRAAYLLPSLSKREVGGKTQRSSSFPSPSIWKRSVLPPVFLSELFWSGLDDSASGSHLVAGSVPGSHFMVV